MTSSPASLDPYLETLAHLHIQLCPRQVLGVRIGLAAGEAFGLDLPRTDKRLLVLVETDGCFADGVSVATGCWLGRRTLRLVDSGRVAATIIDLATERAIRIRPRTDARTRALDWAPEAADRWHAQLAAYQSMPSCALLDIRQVQLATPLDHLLGQAGVRQTCRTCGEEILNRREIQTADGALCRACAGEAYYTGATFSSPHSPFLLGPSTPVHQGM